MVKSYIVDCHSIDSLVASGACKVPDVIKIDAEGHEYQIIRGSKRVIMSKSPAIGFEPHGIGGEDSNTADPIKEFVAPFGYEFLSLGYPKWCYKKVVCNSSEFRK